MTDEILMIALNELDKILQQRSLRIEIVVCGAYAIQLHGYTRGLHTHDIDSLKKISNPELLATIAEVGKKVGLSEKWLNDQASTVSIPAGTFDRLSPLTNHWKAIKASLVSRKDLIKMKASAFSIRREHTTKDWEDLKLLSPSADEMKAAIGFLKQSNSPPSNASQKIKDEFKETLNDLKKLIT